MLKFLKRLFCRHQWEYWRTVYGDEIHFLSCRTIQKCSKCGDFRRTDFC